VLGREFGGLCGEVGFANPTGADGKVGLGRLLLILDGGRNWGRKLSMWLTFIKRH